MKRTKMKYLSETAYEYMISVWGLNHSSEVDDITTVWNSDRPEIVAKMLYEAGAIEPNCKDARELIRVAKSIPKKRFRSELNKALKGE